MLRLLALYQQMLKVFRQSHTFYMLIFEQIKAANGQEKLIHGCNGLLIFKSSHPGRFLQHVHAVAELISGDIRLEILESQYWTWWWNLGTFMKVLCLGPTAFPCTSPLHEFTKHHHVYVA